MKKRLRSNRHLNPLGSALRVTRLEERLAPAVFNISDGDTAGLIAAITTSDANSQPDTINLAANGSYNFSTPYDVTNQLALPIISFDSNAANTLTINGNGSTWTRTGAMQMRFMIVDSESTTQTIVVNQLTMSGANPTADGGVIFLDGGTASFTDCTFNGNSAANAGAIASVSTISSSLTLTNCAFTNNAATSGIGGAVAIQGTVTSNFTNAVFNNNSSDGDGPAVWVQGTDLSMTHCTVTNNLGTGALPEGAIFIQGNLTFTDGDISNNTCVASGGGIFIQGNLNVSNSSITGNLSSDPTSGGGGVFIQGDLVLSDSTVDSNSAGNGGGIALAAGSNTALITNSDITDNSAFFGLAQGGGLYVTSGAVVSIDNSMVAGNTFQAAVTSGQGINIFGSITSLGYNLIGTDDVTITGNTTGDLMGTVASPLDPLLGPLGNYGGNSLTRPLLPGSPALDAGDPNFTPPPDFDQRGAGFPRLIGRLDIGALEATQFNLSITKDDGGLTSAVPGQGIIYTITVTNTGPAPALNANVQDILTAQFGAAVWSATFGGGATGNASGTGSINELVDLPVGGVIVYTLAVAISPDATGTLTNEAQILPPSGGSDPNGADNTAADIDALTPVADVSIVKFTSGGPATPGNILHYTIIVSNDGPSTAFGTEVTDIFRAAIVLANWSSTATGGATGNTGFGSGNIVDFVNVPPNATITYQIDATISADASSGQLVNTATAVVPVTITDPFPDNNTSSTSTNVIIGHQVVVVAPDASQLPIVKLFNPLTGTLRMSIQAYALAFRGGVRVAVADFNGDGTQDIVTAPGPGGGPDIRVYNGLDGTLMYEFFAYAAGFTGGVYVAAGDVNGDGIPDIITGAGPGGGPDVRVFDGAHPGRLLPGPIGEFFAYDANFHGGVRVAVGDTNGDGLDDIITGAGPGGGPHVIVWNGTTRRQLLSFFAYSADFHGGVYVASADMNFDGYADIITGAGEGGGPLVRCFNGRSGLKFREFYAFPQTTGGVGSNAIWSSGVRVATFSDINGDGLSELAVAPGEGRAPTVELIGGALLNQLRAFTAFDPSYLGGVFVGGA